MSDPARKRTIADWVVKTKKQVVKLYAVMKWARDADDVQKAMVSIGFLSNALGTHNNRCFRISPPFLWNKTISLRKRSVE